MVQSKNKKTILQNYFAIIIRLFPIFYPNAFLTTCKVSPPSAQTTASAKAKAQTPFLLTVPNLLTSKLRPPRAKYRQLSYDPNEISPAVLNADEGYTFLSFI